VTRAAERAATVALIKSRANAARQLAKRGQLTESEAADHSRWLDALADDIAAGLHSEGE
jgi:hypothetical protein